MKYFDDLYIARSYEKYYIELFDTLSPNGYNISPTGGFDFINTGLHSEETKKHLSKIRMGKEPWNKGKKNVQICTEKTRQIMSFNNSGEKNWHYGKKNELSPNYGIIRSSETKQKMSVGKIGKNNPNCGIYDIITPDNKYFYVDYGSSEFCRKYPEYSINRHFISKVNKSPNNTYKGWIIKKLN